MLEAYAPVYARAIVIATKLGVFEALRDGGRSADEIAEACGTDPRATAKLLNLLVTMRYLRHRDGAYTLARHVKRWLLADSRGSVRDVILMKELEWSWIDQLETFVRDGRPLDVHGTMSTEDWSAYQRGMRAQANPLASWLARRVPVPAGARDMLDIGGSHGYFSVVLCRRHPQLRATVLDLPDAVEHAAPLLEREAMGDRVVLRAGDALTDDLGEAPTTSSWSSASSITSTMRRTGCSSPVRRVPCDLVDTSSSATPCARRLRAREANREPSSTCTSL